MAIATQALRNKFDKCIKQYVGLFRKKKMHHVTFLLLIYMFLVAARPSSHYVAGSNVQDGYDKLWKKLFPDFKSKVLYSSHQISHFEEWAEAAVKDTFTGIKNGDWPMRVEKHFFGEQYEFPAMLRNFSDVQEVQGTQKLFDTSFGWHRIFEGIYPVKIISASSYVLIDPSEEKQYLPRCAVLGKSKEVIFVRCP